MRQGVFKFAPIIFCRTVGGKLGIKEYSHLIFDDIASLYLPTLLLACHRTNIYYL